MEAKYVRHLAGKLSLAEKQVTAIDSMLAEGATIPFMSRYRKEATGGLDEVVIGNVVEEIAYFNELAKRKETVLKTIGDLGKLTPELQKKIDECYSSNELEDLYLPYKPKRKTRAVMAIEKGLEPLAERLLAQESFDVDALAQTFLNEQVKDIKEALQGARDIIAERVSEDAEARTSIRRLFEKEAGLTAKVLESKREEPEAQKYRDYFEFNEPLAKCPSHRLLAIRRGEKEGYLLMDLTVEKTVAVEILEKQFVKASNPAAAEVKRAVEEGYNRLLKPSIENEFRLLSKSKADEEAITVFAENLRQLLLASPLGSKRVLALDPGYRTGCKTVCLDAQGALQHHTVIYLHQSDKAVHELKYLVDKYGIEAIGIGNGTAGRETEALVRGIDFGKPVSIFQVNESGASIYSASEVAREEFPDQDVTVRGAVSIGRRLLDPLSELVKIDPKSIGVGQYQHDVNPMKLKSALDRVVESAVNFVGVDVNTASKHLLQYVSGISTTLAGNIVLYRNQYGAFKSRDELKKVPLMGPKSFEQCAGFLRIPGAENPLDNSSVHPERYGLVAQMATDLQATLEDLIKKADLRKGIDRKKYVSETAGTYTIDDILKELEKPGRDPRGVVEEFRFEESIKSIEDVKPGMQVPGIVTNITAFGAFVDIGVKQDGLVHVSQLSDRYVTDPNAVVKLNQKVLVTVTEVDVPRKRIALTMKSQGPKTEGAAPARKAGGAAPQRSPQPAKPKEQEGSFADKLASLQMKFRK
ncbi:Tex family protein [Flaviaesturariibacter aridisoli]|uniref:RNA-binding transcriptional accessory protein n=1 Tax=Flaviaesturariibacter aridisoli TaxID=2545761 RepID=A0A4R4E3A9_9BACT|nr:Tex family protein [Flaviaesturariibacter aridisoli]TCZ73303.1 RNA-binding transcriptional accessory protein [Flaviaesturariibacter aridisoli]